MSNQIKVTVSLPIELVDNLRKNIPDRNRSKFIARTIDKELKQIKKQNLIEAYREAYEEIKEENNELDGVTGDGIS